MRGKGLAGLGMVAMFVVGLALTGVLSGIASPTGTTTQSTGFIVGGPQQDFVYDGQAVSASTYGKPWTGASNISAQAGWVKTPLSFDCEAGTLALTQKVDVTAMTVTGTTASFTAPAGAVIVGVLWKSGRTASVTGATWVEDGSSATVTLSRGWGNSRIFYCIPNPSTSGSSNPLTNPITGPLTNPTTT